jgi:clusterin-associated protein 1
LYNAVREAESPHLSKKRTIEPDHTRVDVKELKETRSLTSSLVKKGVTLYDMLSKEVSLREARQQALSKAYEHGEVERIIKSAIETGGQEAKKLSSIIETVQNNLSSVDGKVEKKKSELERSQKRLLTLKKVRPAFMDEYEELQVELALGYQEYVHRFRVLAYLQNQIEDMDRLEQERKTEERLTKAELSRKAGGDDLLSYGNGRNVFLLNSSDDDESSDDVSIKIVPPPTTIQPNNSSRSGVGGGVSRLNKVQRRVFGGMDAVEDSEEESDMILVDGDNDNTTTDDEEELVAIQNKEGLVDGSKMGRTGAHHHANRIDAKNKLNGFNNNEGSF